MRGDPGSRCFNPCFDGSVARGDHCATEVVKAGSGFNPCFDGSVARGKRALDSQLLVELCFNPCFDGSVARGRSIAAASIERRRGVSILVLMEV